MMTLVLAGPRFTGPAYFAPCGNPRLVLQTITVCNTPQVCDSISLYGFSTWPSTGPDQYAGRNKKTITGQKWHDWDGESLTWRLLFSAGHLQICSK